jgi:riboflavin kinase / FMN adenylyltransferase
VVSFEPHPRSWFKPEEPVFRLTPEALKTRLVAALGASFMAVLPFDRALAELSPEDFVTATWWSGSRRRPCGDGL